MSGLLRRLAPLGLLLGSLVAAGCSSAPERSTGAGNRSAPSATTRAPAASPGYSPGRTSATPRQTTAPTGGAGPTTSAPASQSHSRTPSPAAKPSATRTTTSRRPPPPPPPPPPRPGAPIPIPPFEVEDAPWNESGVQTEIASTIREACKDGTLCLKAVAAVAVPPEEDDGSNDCLIRELPPVGELVPRGSTITFVISNECNPPETDPGSSG